MEFKIDGNPGTGNSFTVIQIGNVQNYNPNATTVINNNYGTRLKSQGSKDDTEIDKETIRPKIISYVKKTLEKVSVHWKNKFEPLWNDILRLKEVDAEVYDKGEQQGTDFNRVLVAGIIHILIDARVYDKCTYSSLAIALENNDEHHVRQELGKYPSEEVQAVVKQLLQSKKYK